MSKIFKIFDIMGLTRSTLGGGIPFASDAMFWLDGTISGTDFIDKSGNGYDFAITGKDFDSDWTIGNPYKTAATIAAPAGEAALIAADINNFLYDSGGTPNAIPVVSFFQNIDYEDKLFCRHSDQVVDGNGAETYQPRVLDIVLYENVKTGGDLTKCNTYFGVPTEIVTAVKWVDPVGGNDSTGNGTKALPWLTMQKADTSATIDDTIYIKSGEVDETTYGYLYSTKQLHYKGIGNASLTGANTSYTIRISAAIHPTFTGIHINGEGTTNAPVDFYTVPVTEATFTKCLIGGSDGTFVINTNSANGTCHLNECIVTGDKRSKFYNDCTIQNSYLAGRIEFTTGTLINIKNNKIVSTANLLTSIVLNSTVGTAIPVILGNSITTHGIGISIGSVTSGTLALSITDNNIEVIWVSESAAVYAAITIDEQICVPTIERNNINLSTADVTDFVYAIRLVNITTPTIQYNLFNLESKTQNIALLVVANAGYVTGAIKFNYNRIVSNSLDSADVAFGSEGVLTNRFDNSECIGNRYIGYKVNYPAEGVATTHAFLLNNGINFDIKYNYISDTSLGMVIKTGAQDTYTAKGIYYNIFENCQKSLWIRGVDGVVIYGNTFSNTETGVGLPLENAIILDENSTNPGNYCENIVVRNTIIWSDISLPTDNAIYMDAHAAANGCEADYVIISDANLRAYLFGAATYLTIAAAQVASKMLNSVNVDPVLTNLIPASVGSAIGAGETLAATYDDGLDASTDWGDDTTVPTVVTKQQTGSWDIGAYVS